LGGIIVQEQLAAGDTAALSPWSRPGWCYHVRRGKQVAIELTPRRFTAGEYHQMIEAGVFGQDERLELIDGEIVQMSPIGDRHAACVRRLNELLGHLFAGRALVDVQNPIVVDVAYAPQPDLALLRPRADYYAKQTPTTADCWLVIEVADTSAEFDRQIKAPRYARGGVAELWLIDLERDVVVAYRDPAGNAYQQVQVVHRGETMSIAALGAPGVPVEAILG
jgi:Uma2 family endonuclease